MRVAVTFMIILLISLAMAFKLEKERLAFEDEPDKQDERDEPGEQADLYDEQDEYDLNEPGDYDEQKQDEDEEDNKVIERLKIGSLEKTY